MHDEPDVSSNKATRLEANITKLQRMLNRANAAARAANKENAAAVSELEAHVKRLDKGRIWARVREEETKRMQAEEACRVLHEQGNQQAKELSSRSQKVAKKRQELAGLDFRCKELQAKNADYKVRSNRKLFDVELMAAEIEELKVKI
eukprot:6184107-Pleurochrysis_carterae.AAC.2